MRSPRHAHLRSRRRRANRPGYVPAEVLEERTLLSSVTFGSVFGVGSAGNKDMARGAAADNSGNRFVTGNFSGTVNFNPIADPNGTNPGDTLTSLGSSDAFVALYNSNNSLVWVQQIGSAQGDKIQIDASDNVYVTGTFSGSNVEFGTSNVYLNSANGGTFVAKLNSSGVFQWANNGGGNGVGVDSSGNVYALQETSSGGYTIAKFSSTGGADWSESIATNALYPYGGLAVNASGNVVVGGDFTGTVNFNPSGRADNVSSGPGYAGFVLDLNTNGNLQWVSPFVAENSSAYSNVLSVAQYGSGDIAVAGQYAGSVNFNPGRGVTTLPTIGGGYITELNSSGGLVWAEALQRGSTSGTVAPWGLAVDSAGNIYAAGSFGFSTIALDPADPSETWSSGGVGGNIFVVELSSAGTFGWGTSIEGSGGDVAFGIAVDTSGNVDVVGYYENTVNFNPNPNGPPDDMTANGVADIFVLQLQQS